MLFQTLVYFLAIFFGFAGGVIGTFVVFFAASAADKDPTAGGAYVAFAMLASPFAGIIGSLLSCLVAAYFLNK